MTLNRRQFDRPMMPPKPVKEHPDGHWGRKGPQPGKQGMLVSGGQQQPWPRGFSPERRDEILDVMPSTVGGTPGLAKPEVRDRVRQETVSVEAGQPVYSTESPTIARHREGSRRQTAEMLARSTIPTESLEGLGPILWEKPSDLGRGVAGQYNPSPGPVLKPRISMAAGEDGGVRKGAERTLVHELGHHVSAKQGNPHAPAPRKQRSPRERGMEEGFADSFADEHARPYPGDELSETGYPYGQQYYAHPAEESAFVTGYLEQNPPSSTKHIPGRDPMDKPIPTQRGIPQYARSRGLSDAEVQRWRGRGE